MLCSCYDRELLSATFTANGKRLLSVCHRESLRLVLKLDVYVSQFTVFIESRFSFLNSPFMANVVLKYTVVRSLMNATANNKEIKKQDFTDVLSQLFMANDKRRR